MYIYTHTPPLYAHIFHIHKHTWTSHAYILTYIHICIPTSHLHMHAPHIHSCMPHLYMSTHTTHTYRPFIHNTQTTYIHVIRSHTNDTGVCGMCRACGVVWWGVYIVQDELTATGSMWWVELDYAEEPGLPQVLPVAWPGVDFDTWMPHFPLWTNMVTSIASTGSWAGWSRTHCCLLGVLEHHSSPRHRGPGSPRKKMDVSFCLNLMEKKEKTMSQSGFLLLW